MPPRVHRSGILLMPITARASMIRVVEPKKAFREKSPTG
jgi:hypothetical protein